MPLERDPARENELFLRLAHPHSNIILTPPRNSDVEDRLPAMNDLNIVRYLSGPPYPYTLQDSIDRNGFIAKDCADAETRYREICEGHGAGYLACSPVRVIREVDPQTGEQKYLGDIGFPRSRFDDIIDKEERAKARVANDAREPGDKDIIWEVENMLVSSHHGRGIMSAVVKACISDVLIPLHNAHTIVAVYYTENIGSKKVFEKNGFVEVGVLPNAHTTSAIKGGHTVSYGLLRWERKNHELPTV